MNLERHLGWALASLLAATAPASAQPPDATRASSKTALRGFVVDEAGNPVPGAEVVLNRDIGPFSSQSGNCVGLRVSGSDGSFAFEDVDPFHAHVIRVRHPESATSWLPPIGLNRRPEDVLDVRLRRGRRAIVDVRDEAGSPFPGARVQAHDSGDPSGGHEPVAVAIADDEGRARFEHLPDHFRSYHLSAPGKAAEFLVPEWSDNAPMPCVVSLQRGFSVAGVVVDDIDGTPIADANVAAPLGNWWAVSFLETRTDARGRFRIDGVQETVDRLEVDSESHVRKVIERVPVASSPLTIRMPRMGLLLGAVVDDAGRPVIPFRIVMASDEDPMLWAWNPHQRFDSPEGRFKLRLQPGSESFWVFAEGWAPARAGPFAIGGGIDVQGVDVRLERGCRATGRVVTSAGDGVAGVAVRLRRTLPEPDSSSNQLVQFLRVSAALRAYPGYRALSDATGAWRVDGLPSGRWEAALERKGFASPASADFEVTPLDRSVVVSPVTMFREASVFGTVRTDKGEMDARATVGATRIRDVEGTAPRGPDTVNLRSRSAKSPGPVSRNCDTDPDGRY